MSVFSALRSFWKDYQKKRQNAHAVAPENIGEQAQKLIHLVDLSICNGYLSGAEAHHLQALQEEMGKLIVLTNRNEFQRLSVERRLSLLASLQRSQHKLLVSIHGAQAPTERMQ